MRKRSNLFLTAVLCLAAFGANAETTASDHGHTNASDSAPAATGFFRPDTPIPTEVDRSRGDVPRDSYGRPFAYEYLGEMLPAFSGQLADGESFDSGQLAGSWTIIEIWGLWCHDSMRDSSFAADLSSALQTNPNIDFMSVHTPYTAATASQAYGKFSSVAAYFEGQGYSFPTVVDKTASIRGVLKVRWTPTYLVIAPDLTVQGFRTGLADASGDPVTDFIAQIESVREDWSAATSPTPFASQ